MTEQQFKRWYTFALRMAHRGFPRLPRKSRKKVAEMIKHVISDIRDNYELEEIGDWDGYIDGPNGGLICTPCIVSDCLSDHESCFNPFYYEDGNCEGGRSYRNFQWEEKWWGRVQCCLRAGLDVAVRPSAGVLGFTVCDLRRMYRGNIPAWVNNDWHDPEGRPADLNQGECAVGIWL